MKDIFRKKDLKLLLVFILCIFSHKSLSLSFHHHFSTIIYPSHLSHTSISISIYITNNKTQNLKMELKPNICPNYIFHKFSSLACIYIVRYRLLHKRFIWKHIGMQDKQIFVMSLIHSCVSNVQCTVAFFWVCGCKIAYL